MAADTDRRAPPRYGRRQRRHTETFAGLPVDGEQRMDLRHLLGIRGPRVLSAAVLGALVLHGVALHAQAGGAAGTPLSQGTPVLQGKVVQAAPLAPQLPDAAVVAKVGPSQSDSGPLLIREVRVVGEAPHHSGVQPFHVGDVLDLTFAKGGWGLLQAAAHDRGKKLGLFLNGYFFEGVDAHVLGDDEVQFGPIRLDDNKAFWGDAWSQPAWAPRDVSLSVGLEDATTVARFPTKLSAGPLRVGMALFLIAAGLLLIWKTVSLSTKTSIIRDGVLSDGSPATYSLGRTQMAFWFVNVVLAYLLVWGVSGVLPTVTPSVLALLGIGAGTALGAALVDQSTGSAAPSASTSFWRDILGDGKTTELHRFQMVVWTLVFSVVFWSKVATAIALPDFDPTTLALMGISSGAYLGFKFPENQGSASPAATPGSTAQPKTAGSPQGTTA